jgi:hypothetical protein
MRLQGAAENCTMISFNLYPSLIAARMIESKRTRWMRYVARMGKMKTPFTILL